MPLSLQAGLAFSYCFATNKTKRAAKKAARIVRCCERLSSVPFYIFCQRWWWYPESFQPPQFLEPIHIIFVSWLSHWFLRFGLFIAVLSVAFEDRAAEAKDKFWSACSVLCLRVKRRWDGRNPEINLAGEGNARQRENAAAKRRKSSEGRTARRRAAAPRRRRQQGTSTTHQGTRSRRSQMLNTMD